MAFDLATAKPVESSGFDLSTAKPVEDVSPPTQSTASGAVPYSFADFLKNVASAVVRPVAKGVAFAPLMAMDVGVASRNLIGNAINATTGQPATPNYELPSSIFHTALDAYTRSPTGLGVPAEVISSMLVGSRVPAPQAVTQAPSNFAGPNQALRDLVTQKAQAEGYVVPPASANPTPMNRLLEGISGKEKLQQEAAARNQPITDKLAARALGQNPESPLTQDALSAIRGEASQAGYAPLRQVGDIPTDPKFLSDLKALTQSAQGASKSFPGIQPSSPINDVVTALSQPKFHSSDGLDAMAILRSQADDAFRSGNRTLGTQYKAAAKAVEDMIERHLGSQPGSEGLLDAFRAARQQIAQTYTAAKAVVGDTGSSNALKYAQELARGKPLVGDQRTIASFAAQFRKAAAFQTESMPSISPLDMYGAGIAQMAGHSLLPFGYPLSRIALREYLLSGAGQARAVPQAFKPQETMGAVGGLASVVSNYLGR